MKRSGGLSLGLNGELPVPFQGLVNRIQQGLVLHRLLQEVRRPALHGLDAQGHGTVGREEDDGEVNSSLGHFFLEVKTA
jgi:hypothetical protein